MFHSPNLAGRRRAFETAAARKRLLYARYLGWAEGSGREPGRLISPAAERVLHATLRSARDPAEKRPF